MKHNKQSSWLTGFFFVLIVSLVPLVNLLYPGLPITHDGQDHVARIANFYRSLVEGNIVPRWAGNLNWGYGHPVMMFLYPLPSYLASLFHLIGFSLVESVKIVFGVSYIASLAAMYLWTATAWGTLPGIVATILYGYAPYRFVDLYVRGAIGEHVAFVFLPLVLWGLCLLARQPTNVWGGAVVSLGTAALILSHNAVSLMFLPVIALYAVYLFHFEANQGSKLLVSRGARSRFAGLSSWFLFLGFLMSAFFWFPAFFEGKYTLRDVVTKGEFGERFVPWTWFFVSPWNYGGGNQFTKSLGVAQWLAVGASLFVVRSLKSGLRTFAVGALGILVVSLFLMTAHSEFIWETVTILQKFQFPWRLLSLSVFLAAVLGAVMIFQLPKKFVIFVSTLIVFVSFVSTQHMWRAKEYKTYPVSFFAGIYNGTTDTGESSPIWSIRFMEQRPAAPMEVIEGKATVQAETRSSTKHIYQVTAATKARLVENTLYFPGWKVFVDGKETSVEFQDPTYRGLMTFWVDSGIHKVVVQFRDTKLRKAANSLSILGAILFLGFIGTIKLWQKRLFR